jgi:hypothetical protein
VSKHVCDMTSKYLLNVPSAFDQCIFVTLSLQRIHAGTNKSSWYNTVTFEKIDPRLLALIEKLFND